MRKRVALHCGSYWNGSNDIVNLMQRSLARLPELSAVAFDARLYDGAPSPHVETEGIVNWIRDDVLQQLLSAHRPDLLICTAGGLSPTPAAHQRLKASGLRTVGIELSDPDAFPHRGKRLAGLFDHFYTNATESIARYEAMNVRARLLPFAADPVFHRPLGHAKTCDVVIVGAMRPDRVNLVAAMRASGLRVHCYGRRWGVPEAKVESRARPSLMKLLRKDPGRLPRWTGWPDSHSAVHGQEHTAAINSGTVYLSFAATLAGFSNVKVGVFEAAACGACVLVQDMEELHRYFTPGQEIVTYASDQDAVDKAAYFRRNPHHAARIGHAARARVLAEHTWEHRWRAVLRDVDEAA